MLALAILYAQIAIPWRPPPERPAAQARHAPVAKKGRNIFAGDKEQWLAEAVAKLGEPYVAKYADGATAVYIQQLGQYLADHSTKTARPFRFLVTTNGEPNAESAGAGLVRVNLGLLRLVADEDELACLIAHEIGHDEFGHLPKTVTRLFYWLAGIKRVNSREQIENGLAKVEQYYKANPAAAMLESLSGIRRSNELQADRAAFYTTYRAGYNPYACRAGLQKLETKQEALLTQLHDLLLSSHPPPPLRAAALSWESNFVKLPHKRQRFASAAFDEMKKSVTRP